MCTAAATTFSGLMAARFFLGVGEAAIGPGFSLIVGMFYKREEQPARQAAWFMGNCISMIIGGVVAYGVGNVHTGAVRSWPLLFLVLGAITSGMALVSRRLVAGYAQVGYISYQDRARHCRAAHAEE